MQNNFFIIFLFCKQNYIIKYKRSYLGFLWVLMNPILLLISTSVVFSSLFKVNFDEYFPFIFSGLIPWFLINQSIISSSTILLTNENIIKKHKFNLALLPISSVLVSLIDSFFFLILYISYLFIFNKLFNFNLIYIFLSYILIGIFCLGIAFFVSLLTVYVRDLQWILQVGFQSIFYMTPILYKPGEITGFFGRIFSFNPVSLFVILFNKCLNGHAIETSLLFFATLISIIFGFLGFLFFYRFSRKIVYSL